MSVATLEVTDTTTTTAKPVTSKTAKQAKPVTLTGQALDTAAATLKARYIAADKGETLARTAFEAADIAWQNARVIKVRVAYAAAMLTPNKGAANLLAATRYLLTDPTDTPAKRTAAAKSRKNTLRNYVAAGEALQEAGLIAPDKITEPDDNERKIVADVFREMNKRDKAEANGTGEPGNGEPGNDGDTDTDGGDDLALSVTDLMVKLGELNKTFNLIKTAGVVVSEADAGQVAEMLAEFSAQLAEYADGK